PVLAHQRRGEPQPPARLDLRRHPEDRRGQQVDLVVDDQPPVPAGEEPQVRELLLDRAALADELPRRPALPAVLSRLVAGVRPGSRRRPRRRRPPGAGRRAARTPDRRASVRAAPAPAVRPARSRPGPPPGSRTRPGRASGGRAARAPPRTSARPAAGPGTAPA